MKLNPAVIHLVNVNFLSPRQILHYHIDEMYGFLRALAERWHATGPTVTTNAQRQKEERNQEIVGHARVVNRSQFSEAEMELPGRNRSIVSISI